MTPSAYAFAKAIVGYNARLNEAGLHAIAGDRWVFRIIAAVILLADRDGKPITAVKLAQDAESVGLSGRTAVRLCRSMVEQGFLSKGKPAGRATPLHATDKLRLMWARQSSIFIEEAKRAGLHP